MAVTCPVSTLAQNHCAGEDKHSQALHFWTGPEKGYYYQVGRAIAAAAKHGASGLKIHACVSEGSASNMAALVRKDADFAIVQSDVAHEAWHCEHPLMESLGSNCDREMQRVKLVTPLFLEKAQILLRPHLYVSSLADLRWSHCVWIGANGSGSEPTAQVLLQASGWSTQQIAEAQSGCKTKPASIDEALTRLRRAEDIDAIIQTRVAPTKTIYDALKNSEIQMIGLDSGALERLTHDEVYQPASIQRGDYPVLRHSVYTVGVQALLLVRSDVDPDAIRAIAQLIHDERDDIEHHLYRSLVALAGPEAPLNPDEDSPTPADARVVDPSTLSLVGARPSNAANDHVDEDVKEFLWEFPLRQPTLVQLGILLALFVGAIALLRYHPRGRSLMQSYYREVVFLFGVATLWLFAAVWLQAVEGQLNDHYTTLVASAGALGENILAKFPVQLVNAPAPTTPSGQALVSFFSYLGFLVLTVYALPFLRKRWQQTRPYLLGPDTPPAKKKKADPANAAQIERSDEAVRARAANG